MKWTKLSQIQTIGGNVGTEVKFKDAGRWRDLTAYWILGLCNNYGYVVMLSAAHDIIGRLNSSHDSVSFIVCAFKLYILLTREPTPLYLILA